MLSSTFCDELGYVIPSKEQADCVFQIFSKRTEVTTTLVTTNLLCGSPHNKFNAEFMVMRSPLVAGPA